MFLTVDFVIHRRSLNAPRLSTTRWTPSPLGQGGPTCSFRDRVPKSEQLERVVPRAHHQQLPVHPFQSSQWELPEAAALFDLREHRLQRQVCRKCQMKNWHMIMIRIWTEGAIRV